MKEEYIDHSKGIKFLDILLIFLILSFTYSFAFASFFKNFSYYMSICVIICAVLIALRQKVKMSKLHFYFLIFCFYNCLFCFYNFSLEALYTVMQEIVLLIFSVIIISIKFEKDYLEKLKKTFSIMYYILLFLMIIIHLTSMNNMISYSICKALFALSFFAFNKTNHKFVFCLLSACVFLFLGERTSGLIFLIVYGIYFLEGRIKKKFTFNLLFWLVVIALISFIIIYIKLPSTAIGMKLNAYSREIFHENLFSGRNVLWSEILNLISNNKLFGLTYSNNVSLYYNAILSTHSLYLWLLLNGGYVLLTMFVLLLYNCWKTYFPLIKDEFVRSSSSYFLGLLILCNYELLLLTNNFSISLIMWFVISIGLSYVMHTRDKS